MARTSRRLPSWYSASSALLVLAVLVSLLAVIGTRHFRHVADAANHTQLVLERAHAQINGQDAFEWRAIAGRTVYDAQVREIDVRQRATRSALRELGPSGGTTPAAFEPYAHAVRLEFTLLRAGRHREADRVDELRVDPSFARLSDAIETASDDSAEQARSADRQATTASWLILAAATFAIVALLALFYRTRQGQLRNEIRRSTLERQVTVMGQVASDREYDANHDELTGLANRRHFLGRLNVAVTMAELGGPRFAVVLIDLDRFKEINDTLGHQAGDAVLAQLAPRLQSALREGDLLARLGGDEFALLIPAGPRVETEALTRLLKRIGDAVVEPFDILGLSLQIRASMGISLFPEHGRDDQTLLRHADVAMYRAKSDRSGHAYYANELDANSVEQLTLIADIRAALDGGQFVLHYQPKADLGTGVTDSVEALVRWQHPTRGLLAPDAFLPAAEQAGLMRPLTLEVLEQALGQCARWRQAGHDIAIAVNLSITNLIDPELAADIIRLLAAHRVEPRLLQLEITETVIMAEPERVMAFIAELVAAGVSFSLDDFGTGYSSLAYLKRLNVREIKIDRSFVTELASNAEDAMIVRSTVDLARSLDLRVVAEGVEDGESWRLLRDIGCHQAQGYYLSRPIPAEELTAWFGTRRSATMPSGGRL